MEGRPNLDDDTFVETLEMIKILHQLRFKSVQTRIEFRVADDTKLLRQAVATSNLK